VIAQLGAIIRLELKKSFFGRRGLWIYLLAIAPAVLYLIHAIDVTHDHEHRQALAAAHPVSSFALRSIAPGASEQEALDKLGEPYDRNTFNTGRRRGGGGRGAPPGGGEMHLLRYTDGDNDFAFFFVDGTLRNVSEQDRCNIQKDSVIFATVFQFFYLRLVIFFGCVGIFMNLFRGEMLDKSLHFYLLSPVRREVLMAGKFLAGLIVAVTTFTIGTALQLLALSWHFDPGAVSQYLHGPGWGQIGSYLGVTMLACLGYGSIFLAAGLRFRNPILPGAAVLIWEAANLFLPSALKKVSIIYYLQSLCPVVASPDKDLSTFLRLLVNAAEPVAPWVAITGLLAVSGAVLVVAAFRVRTLEINYGTE
jgi:ABC-type transport system involved in multi-copper enzyme maturation permease subunit